LSNTRALISLIGAVIGGIQMSELKANNWGITGLSPPTSIISSFKRSVYEGVTLKPCSMYFFALLIGTKKYAQLCWPSRPNNHYSRRHSEYKLARVKSFYFLQVGRECRAYKGVWHLTFSCQKVIKIWSFILKETLTHQLSFLKITCVKLKSQHS
jgi:hypothetical protein